MRTEALPCLIELERKEQELEQLRMDCQHFKAKLETVQADSLRDKKVGSRDPSPRSRRPLRGCSHSGVWAADTVMATREHA